MQVKISDSIKYIGVDDKTIDLFESQYLVPNGISYNSYLIVDERLQLWIRLTREKLTNGLKILTESLTAELPIIL